MTIIVMVPVIMNRPYTLLRQGSSYTEDSIEYNDWYQQLFSTNGNADSDDFLLMSYYEVAAGKSVLVTLDMIPDSATIYRLALFIVDVEITILKTQISPDNPFIYSFTITEYAMYGIAVFGHKLADNVGLELGFVVLV